MQISKHEESTSPVDEDTLRHMYFCRLGNNENLYELCDESNKDTLMAWVRQDVTQALVRVSNWFDPEQDAAEQGNAFVETFGLKSDLIDLLAQITEEWTELLKKEDVISLDLASCHRYLYHILRVPSVRLSVASVEHVQWIQQRLWKSRHRLHEEDPCFLHLEKGVFPLHEKRKTIDINQDLRIECDKEFYVFVSQGVSNRDDVFHTLFSADDTKVAFLEYPPTETKHELFFDVDPYGEHWYRNLRNVRSEQLICSSPLKPSRSSVIRLLDRFENNVKHRESDVSAIVIGVKKNHILTTAFAYKPIDDYTDPDEDIKESVLKKEGGYAICGPGHFQALHRVIWALNKDDWETLFARQQVNEAMVYLFTPINL